MDEVMRGVHNRQQSIPGVLSGDVGDACDFKMQSEADIRFIVANDTQLAVSPCLRRKHDTISLALEHNCPATVPILRLDLPRILEMLLLLSFIYSFAIILVLLATTRSVTGVSDPSCHRRAASCAFLTPPKAQCKLNCPTAHASRDENPHMLCPAL